MVVRHSARALLTAILAICTGPAAHASHADDSRNTTTLTKDTFDLHIEKQRERQRPCLVMFHVSWCKVCQKVFPKFAAASDLVYEKENKMDFAHVDCTDDKSLCHRFTVKGYPTIKLFLPEKDTEPMNYRNPRTEQGFVKYAERMTQPALRKFSGVEQLLKELSNETLAAFIAAVGSTDSSSSKSIAHPAGIVAMAGKWMDRHIFAVNPRLQDLIPVGIQVPDGATLAAISAGKQQWPGRKNTTQPPPAVVFYKGSLDDVEAVGQWIERNRFPGIWALDDSTFYDFTHASRSTVMIAVDPANVSEFCEERIRTSMAKHADEFTFGVLDGVSYSEELRDFNIVKKDLPRVLITENDLEAWIEDVEHIRANFLESDLSEFLLNVHQPLRQKRTMWSKLFFYKREAARFAISIYSYASQGILQTILTCAGIFIVAVTLFVVLWCVVQCCQALLSEDVEPEYIQRRQKRE